MEPRRPWVLRGERTQRAVYAPLSKCGASLPYAHRAVGRPDGRARAVSPVRTGVPSASCGRKATDEKTRREKDQRGWRRRQRQRRQRFVGNCHRDGGDGDVADCECSVRCPRRRMSGVFRELRSVCVCAAGKIKELFWATTAGKIIVDSACGGSGGGGGSNDDGRASRCRSRGRSRPDISAIAAGHPYLGAVSDAPNKNEAAVRESVCVCERERERNYLPLNRRQ